MAYFRSRITVLFWTYSLSVLTGMHLQSSGYTQTTAYVFLMRLPHPSESGYVPLLPAPVPPLTLVNFDAKPRPVNDEK